MRRSRSATGGSLVALGGLLWLSGCAADAGGGPGQNVSNILPPSGSGTGAPTATAGSMAWMGTGGTAAPGMTGFAGRGAGSAGTGVVPSTGNQAIPCNVAASVKANCQGCHGATPIGGAPMSLLTYADFHQDYVVKTTKGLVGQTRKLYELAHTRLNSSADPMPPSGSLTVPADRPLLNDWLAAGALAGDPNAADCAMQPGPTGGTGPSDGGTGGSGTVGEDDYDFNPPTPTLPGEECFELQMHGGQTPGDTSPYTVEAREYYMQFYFKVPWPTGWLGTKAGARYDKLQVLHHWLLFTTTRALSADGTHEEVIGTQLGDVAQLIQGWAIGGATSKMPPGVGFELPPANSMLNLQWHYYNSTGQPQPDRTALIMCAVPPDSVEHTASMTWLGTENITVPAGSTGTATGSCINDSGGPITIVFFVPHMHNIGRHMKSVVVRNSGMMETVFDKPFANDTQLQYAANVVLQPNETIISTCTFQNDGLGNVGFGTSTTQEMCYQFAASYPAHALDNGVISLIGATNTCWQFGE